MKNFKTALAAILSIAALLFSLTALSASQRSLTRTDDFVVLQGEEVRGVMGADVHGLRLYACSKNSCRPVTMQVDKVDAIGRYVFPQDQNQDRDGKLFDANDEISFMVGDAGGRKPDGFKPPGATRCVEIEITDPLDKGKAWAYLCDVPGSPEPDVPDYVSYEVRDGTVYIESSRYALGYEKGKINYDVLRMSKGPDMLSPDVLDRQMVGMEASLIGENDIKLNAPESIVRTEDIAWIDGKVRVIVDQIVSVHIGALSFQWGSELFMRFYRCGQNNEVDFSFPMTTNSLVKSILFYWSLDFSDDIIGAYYMDELHPEPVLIENREQIETIKGGDQYYWWGLYGEQGAVLQALDLDEDILPYFGCFGRWIQDPQARDRKGDHPGKLEIGFSCREVTEIPERQNYHWQNYILVPERPDKKSLLALSNIFLHPVEINVTSLAIP